MSLAYGWSSRSETRFPSFEGWAGSGRPTTVVVVDACARRGDGDRRERVRPTEDRRGTTAMNTASWIISIIAIAIVMAIALREFRTKR
jgi:hypothetical protein